jgi:hypothetical protein
MPDITYALQKVSPYPFILVDKLLYYEIKKVIAVFSGADDSGEVNITSAVTIDGEPVTEAQLDAILVPQAALEMTNEYERDQVTDLLRLRDFTKNPPTLREIINDSAYRILEHIHGGWEINSGSFGTIVFEPAPNPEDADVHVDYSTRDYDEDDAEEDEDYYSDESPDEDE